MNENLFEIRNKIINNILAISALFIIPAIPIFIHVVHLNGFHFVYIVTCLFFLINLSLAAFRKHLPFKFKIHVISIGYFFMGLAVFYHASFSGVFYFCFIPILLNGILIGKKSALIYLIFVAIGYCIIAYGFSSGVFTPHFNHENEFTDLYSWIHFSLGTLLVLIIIHYSTTLLFNHLSLIIDSKNQLTKKLEEHQAELENQVRERTDEIATAYKKLKIINNELHSKNRRIAEQNEELNNTLKKLKEAQSSLVQQEKMASLGILTAGIAHEMNNPINFILGAYEGLKNRLAESNDNDLRDKHVSTLLDSLKTGANRATYLIKSLNQFNRSTENNNEHCHLHRIIDNCLIIIQNQLKHRIKVVKNYYPGDLVAIGNVGNLHQAFINILTNASQAIKEQGTITILTKLEDNNIIVRISDTGIGISAENMPYITDPFYSTKPPGEGTGLGLSITYNIIKEQNGRMTFTSEEGQGTNVEVILPNKSGYLG